MAPCSLKRTAVPLGVCTDNLTRRRTSRNASHDSHSGAEVTGSAIFERTKELVV